MACSCLLGPLFGHSWAVLGASRAVSGASWAVLGTSWGPLGPSWSDLGGLLSLLGQSGAWKSKSAKIDLNLLNFTVFCLLGPSQGVLLELSWVFFGASWAVLRPSWAVLERSRPSCSLLGALQPSWKSSWTFLSPLGGNYEAMLRPIRTMLGLFWAV